MKVPQLKPWIGKDEYKAIKACFDANWITEGPKSQEFSEKLLQLIGAKYGVFAPNGTLALYLGLRALGIGPGDEVLVPDFTFIASANAVEMTGATPVFVDVNRENFQVDISTADKLVAKNTKAIMPVHIYGTACDMDPITAFAKKHKISIIEDAAESVGVKYKGKHTGTFGEVGCFSFFADKTITTGEGAYVVTNDENTYDNLLFLRNQGRKNRGSFIHPKIGYNFRMTDIQNAVGLVQLAKLEEIKERKTKKLKLYQDLLKGFDQITFFKPEENSNFIPFRVCILIERAHELMEYMKDKDIEPRTFFYPLHKQPCYEHLNSSRPKFHKYEDSNFPNAVYGFENGICLPVFPELKESQIKYICSTIKDFIRAKK